MKEYDLQDLDFRFFNCIFNNFVIYKMKIASCEVVNRYFLYTGESMIIFRGSNSLLYFDSPVIAFNSGCIPLRLSQAFRTSSGDSALDSPDVHS